MKALLWGCGLLGLLSLSAACAREDCTADGDCDEDQFCQFTLGECEGDGKCTIQDENCPQGQVVGEPRVCGCDNQTYDNDCLRRQAGVSKLHELACD